MARITFSNRHSFEEWLYMHAYNMIADDHIYPENTDVFNPQSYRQAVQAAAKDVSRKHSYASFCLKGFGTRIQVDMVYETYDQALQSYFAEEKGLKAIN